jgi:hypothetical protein
MTDQDYKKVFRKKGKDKKPAKTKDTNNDDDNDEVIYEVGEGGVDISD